MHRSELRSIDSRLRLPISTVILLGIIAMFGWSPAFPQPNFPSPEGYSTHRFDSSDELKIAGPILKVETTDVGTIIWMRPTTVTKQGKGSRPGQNDREGKGHIWRVEGPGVDKLKDKAKLISGSVVTVIGYNSVDKSCKPTCRIKISRLTFS